MGLSAGTAGNPALHRCLPAPLDSKPSHGRPGKAAKAVPRARARDPYLKPRVASAGPLPCPRSRPPARPPPLPAATRRQPGHPRRRGGASAAPPPPGAQAVCSASRGLAPTTWLPTRRPPSLGSFSHPLGTLLGPAFYPIRKSSL
jgi:hypothetical protein